LYPSQDQFDWVLQERALRTRDTNDYIQKLLEKYLPSQFFLRDKPVIHAVSGIQQGVSALFDIPGLLELQPD
jgi:hypothetical protein